MTPHKNKTWNLVIEVEPDFADELRDLLDAQERLKGLLREKGHALVCELCGPLGLMSLGGTATISPFAYLKLHKLLTAKQKARTA